MTEANKIKVIKVILTAVISAVMLIALYYASGGDGPDGANSKKLADVTLGDFSAVLYAAAFVHAVLRSILGNGSN